MKLYVSCDYLIEFTIIFLIIEKLNIISHNSIVHSINSLIIKMLSSTDIQDVPDEHHMCSPPLLDETIYVDKPECRYLHRAISQNKTSLAIEWLNKWKNEPLAEMLNGEKNWDYVLWQCVTKYNDELISYLLKHNLVTIDQVEKLKKENDRINSLNYL